MVSLTAPVAAAAQIEPPPMETSVVSRVVASALAWAGLSGSLTDSPVAPVESPALLAVLAAWRRQSQQALAGKISTNLADLPQTSQPVDTMVTGEQAVADLSTMQLSAPMSLAAAVADTTAPAVSLTAPVDGAHIRRYVVLSATASDDVGVVGVRFLVNGKPVYNEDTKAPYSVTWNTPITTGTYTLAARARDAAGNVTTSEAVTVTVDNT